LGREGDDAGVVAARVRESAVSAEIVAALDDWAVCAEKGPRAWLLRVARQADPDPGGWRDRARNPERWAEPAELVELARTAPVAADAVPLLLAVGRQLQAAGGDAPGFLRRVQREHPTDFWANLTLGNSLKYVGAGEAIAYYRVAVAIRPGAAVGYYGLGEVLRFQDWLDEAIDYYRRAIHIDPQLFWAHLNRGSLLVEKQRPDEALEHFRRAFAMDPRSFAAHLHLGGALRDRGRLDEALDHFREALAMDPNNSAPRNGVRSVLMRRGRGEEVRAAWRKVLEANPPDHEAWFGYAELCLFLGQEDEYLRARRALLARFGTSTDLIVAERTGRACLLLHAGGDELLRAAALTDRTATAGPEYSWARPYFLFARGLAEYRRGRHDSAVSLLAGDAPQGIPPAPRLVVAMARHRQGQREEARRVLAAAVLAFDWREARADNRDAWICHVLRREAEALILPDLPAFLRGDYRPRDNDERLALLGVCQFKGLHRAAAGLYADAFAADPKLADDFQAGHRYRAACFAVLAAGRGEGAGKPGDEERARLRGRALDWLRADLAAWARGTDPTLVETTLKRWQQDGDLAGVRDPGALARLPAAEREAWRRLWSGVADLLQAPAGRR
jgi:serine/threonine-protein kinase